MLLLASWLSEASSQMASVADIIRAGGDGYAGEAEEARALVRQCEAMLEKIEPEIPCLGEDAAAFPLTELGARAAEQGIAAAALGKEQPEAP